VVASLQYLFEDIRKEGEFERQTWGINRPDYRTPELRSIIHQLYK
jgi:hypothetical protein